MNLPFLLQLCLLGLAVISSNHVSAQQILNTHNDNRNNDKLNKNGGERGQHQSHQQQEQQQQGHRELYGERLRGAAQRGGAAGRFKAYYDVIPMRDRIVVPAPAPNLPPAFSPSDGVTGVSSPTDDGCTFEEDDGTETTFETGAAMEGYKNMDTCTNNVNDFPCYCIPGVSDQTLCPYCQFQTVSDTILCAKNKGFVNVVTTPGMGATTCHCNATIVPVVGDTYGVYLESNCELYNIGVDQDDIQSTTTAPAAAPKPIPLGPTPPTDDGCSFVDEDGVVAMFNQGESLGDYKGLEGCENGDATDFPCYCDTRAPDQVICPYCQFEDFFGRKFCGKAQSFTSFNGPNFYMTTCGCSINYNVPESPYGITISSACDLMNNEYTIAPSAMPSTAPTSSPTSVPSASPTAVPTTSTSPSSAPTKKALEQSTTTTEAPMADDSDGGGGCRFVDNNFGGMVATFAEGDNLGSYKTLPQCINGNTLDYPCYCDSKVPGQVVCPYCRYTDFYGRTLCARDEETLRFRGNLLAFRFCTCNVDRNDPNSPYGLSITSNCDMVSTDFPHP